MNKPQLKFLKKLNENIDKACPMLETDRANFMPRLTSFFQAVSLGMELGVAMKGSKAGSKKESKSQAKKSKLKGRTPQKGRPEKIAVKLRALMKKGPATLADMHKAIDPLLKDSADTKGYLNKFLHSNAKEFERVPNERGIYRLKAVKAPNGKAVTATTAN
jgi:hypothetical protein